jgi:hypothetical protein
VTIVTIAWNGVLAEFIQGNCMEVHDSMFKCLGIVLFEAHQAIAFVSFSALLSITPLFFLKEHAYRAWRTLAFIALPVILILIYIAPATSGGWLPLGYDREFASMFYSGLFLVISWAIILRKVLQR